MPWPYDPWAGESLEEFWAPYYQQQQGYSPSMVQFSETPYWSAGILWVPYYDQTTGQQIMVDADSPAGRAARTAQIFGGGPQAQVPDGGFPSTELVEQPGLPTPPDVNTAPSLEEQIAGAAELLRTLSIDQQPEMPGAPPDFSVTGTGQMPGTNNGLSNAELAALIASGSLAGLGLGGILGAPGGDFEATRVDPYPTEPSQEPSDLGETPPLPPPDFSVTGTGVADIPTQPVLLPANLDIFRLPPDRWNVPYAPAPIPDKLPPGPGTKPPPGEPGKPKLPKGWPEMPDLTGAGGAGGPIAAPIFGGVGGKSPIQSLFQTAPYQPQMVPTLGQFLRMFGR